VPASPLNNHYPAQGEASKSVLLASHSGLSTGETGHLPGRGPCRGLEYPAVLEWPAMRLRYIYIQQAKPAHLPSRRPTQGKEGQKFATLHLVLLFPFQGLCCKESTTDHDLHLAVITFHCFGRHKRTSLLVPHSNPIYQDGNLNRYKTLDLCSVIKGSTPSTNPRLGGTPKPSSPTE
jgi:hypothetical protein